jgi:hypothetical protein
VIDSKLGDISKDVSSQFMNRSRSLHAITAVGDYKVASSNIHTKREKWVVPKKDLTKFYEHTTSQSSFGNYHSIGANIDSVHKVDSDIRITSDRNTNHV